MNTTEKGNIFEIYVLEIIRDLLSDGSFFLNDKTSKVFSKKAYYSKERNGEIVTDISIETTIKDSDKYSLLTIIECKDLSTPVPVDDIEEFDSKLRQLGEHNVKGILISKSGFQKSTISFSKSKGIGLILIKVNKEIDWINYRKDKIKPEFTRKNIEEKLTDVNILDSNFFGYYSLSAFDNFPSLLIHLGIIDQYANRPKYFNLPFIEKKDICYMVDPLTKLGLYSNDALNFENTCRYLNDTMAVDFEFEQKMSAELLGKINLTPLKIYVNPNLKNEIYRWRFTLAHEIGHLFLHKEYLKDFVSENIDDENHIALNYADSLNFNKRFEIQANLFASELLMPITKVFKNAERYFEKENINEGYLYLDNQPCNQSLVFNFLRILQVNFQVSLEVARIRLINLHLLHDDTDISIRSILKRMFK